MANSLNERGSMMLKRKTHHPLPVHTEGGSALVHRLVFGPAAGGGGFTLTLTAGETEVRLFLAKAEAGIWPSDCLMAVGTSLLRSKQRRRQKSAYSLPSSVADEHTRKFCQNILSD